MNYLWRIIRNAMAVIGVFLLYGGVSTSDYYVMELGQAEPAHVWAMVVIGLVLMIPATVHLIRK